MNIAMIISITLVAIAAVPTIYVIIRGPGPIDRVIATDVLLAIVMLGIAIEGAANHHAYTVPVIFVISLLAFTGTVAMARFVANRQELIGPRPKTPEAAQDSDADESWEETP